MRATCEFADELSMLGLTWSMLHAVLTVRQSPAMVQIISLGLTAIFSGFSAFYIKSALIIYQVIAFASGIALVTARSQYLYHVSKPAFPREKARDWNIRTWQAIGICLFGYVLWNIDLEYCLQLREIKARLGLPWSWLLELHGWWHVFTAIGADRFMNVAREVREAARQDKKPQKKQTK